MRQSLRSSAARCAPYAALAAVMLALHLQFTLGTGDDVMYSQTLLQSSLYDFSVWHYYTWSARTLVEAVMVIVESWPALVWRLLDPFVIALGALCGAQLLGLRGRPSSEWALCAAVLCYPWSDMSTAGWICTTLVFVWPLTAALASACALQKAARTGRAGLFAAALSCAGLLYAANMELLCGAYLICLAGFFAARIFSRERIPALFWAQTAVCAANLVWSLTCPGTQMRYENQIASSFCDYGLLRFFQKLSVGIHAAAANTLFTAHIGAAVLFGILAVSVWAGTRRRLPRAASLAPAAFFAVFGFAAAPLSALVPQTMFFTHMSSAYGGPIRVETAGMWKSYVPLFAAAGLIAAACAMLCLALGLTRRTWQVLCALAAGAAAYAVMGFSPSVYDSGPRTGFFLGMALPAACAAVFDALPARTKARPAAAAILAAGAAYGVFALIGA